MLKVDIIFCLSFYFSESQNDVPDWGIKPNNFPCILIDIKKEVIVLTRTKGFWVEGKYGCIDIDGKKK